MGTWPKVSIVLINYNGYRDTIECLQSLREISYTNYEVIVVDNASTNESVKEIRDFIGEGEILIPSEVNGGFSAGNNIGIKYALGRGAEYCLLLNNDTVVEASFLEDLIAPFSSNRKCGLTIGKILYESKRDTVWYAGGDINSRTARTQHWHYRKKDEGLPEKIEPVSFATGCCMCLSRNAIETVGFMNEDYFMYVEDAEYCMKLKSAGFELLYVPSSRIYHKVSASTEGASAFSQFYTVRNKLMLIKDNIMPQNKYSAYLYTIFQYLYRCLKGEYSLGAVTKAIKAFKKGEAGRSSLF